MSQDQKRKVEAEIEKLADDDINCRVEGDSVVCTGEILKTQEEQIRIPANEFTADIARKKFEDRQLPQH